MKELTDRQREVLGFIARHIEESGSGPTHMRIADEFDISAAAAAGHVRRLELAGAVRIRRGEKGGIEVIAPRA